MEMDTPTSEQILGEGVATDGYEADERDNDESEDGDDDSEDDERPAERDATAPRQHKCNCADGVPAGFITRCSTKKVINPGK
jgi:hypothetical protein